MRNAACALICLELRNQVRLGEGGVRTIPGSRNLY